MQTDSSLCELLLQVCSDFDLQPAGFPSPTASDNKQQQRSERSPSPQGGALQYIRESMLQSFHFTRADLLLIASLYQQYIEVERPISLVRLLREVTKKKAKFLIHANQVLRLAFDGILTLSKPGVPGFPLTTGLLFANHNIEEDILQGHEVSLSKPFLSFLLDEQRPVLTEVGFESNRDFLREAFLCCQSAQRYFNVPEEQWRIDLFDVRVAERYENLLHRLRLTQINIPFGYLIKKHDLNRNEQLTLIHLVERESYRLSTDIGQLTRIIEPDQFHRNEVESVLSTDGTLHKNNLIQIEKKLTSTGATTVITLEPELFKYIGSQGRHVQGASNQDICRSNSAISIKRPANNINQLVLPEKEMGFLLSAIQACRIENQSVLRKWGLVQIDEANTTSHETQQTIILLSGQPGVGKTMAAKVIADALDKELMCADISEIKGMWVGESEKNLRSVFSSYQECLTRSDNPPILFLNECDQFLTRRIENVRHSADQMLNSMQNMLLEFFEDFTGICVATTNLATNLDPAFSRRFTHKIELPLPDTSTREKLWNTIIPSALPLSTDFNVQTLARKYSFSGSQIKTVIFNTAQEVASRHPGQQVVNQADIIKYAELERLGSFDDSQVNRIGFNQANWSEE